MKVSGKLGTHRLATGAISHFEKAGYTPETLENKINEYFDTITPEIVKVINQGKVIDKKVKLYTLPGLCRFIGFESRQSYWEWMRKVNSPYCLPLKKGYLRLQEFLEKQAFLSGNPAGPIFILKNMDYSDNQTLNSVSSDGSMSPRPIIVSHSKELDKASTKATNRLFKGSGKINQEIIGEN